MYQEMLCDLPNEVLKAAARECLLTCRFFPTIAEIRERAIPHLQEFNLCNRRQIENKLRCDELVKWQENYPWCACEFDTAEYCERVGTGLCKKWEVPRIENKVKGEN